MGYNLKIDSFVHIKRTEMQKKALEEEIKKLENETNEKGDILSYDVKTKEKFYSSYKDLEYLNKEPKEYFVYKNDIELVSKTDTFIFINALRKFYGIDFFTYKYENVTLEDLKGILALLEPDVEEDDYDVEYIRSKVTRFIDGIKETINQNKIEDSRILSFTFNFTLV